MKKGVTIITLLLALSFIGCNTNGKSDNEESYNYSETNAELNPELKAKLGDWVKQGVECYGVLVALNTEGIPQVGKPIRAKVIRIKKDQIKMKCLENVSFGPQEGCSKMGIASGETWWEKEGDLFQTEEEALAFLRKKGILLLE